MYENTIFSAVAAEITYKGKQVYEVTFIEQKNLFELGPPVGVLENQITNHCLVILYAHKE